ncbi:MAG: 4-hydroxy-3-methylbut-2-enyl diphosphate reductase [Elusimicrobiaceae bacterium]
MSYKDTSVLLAKTSGFCPGVKKAIDSVLELAQKGRKPIYTLGPLIHNPQVIQMLEEKNIRAVKSLDEIKDTGGVIVLRAHGITPELEAKVRATNMEVVDATCPLVKRVQKVIEEYAGQGYHTVIVGDEGHAEVTGLMGYAKGNGTVVSGPEAARQLPRFEKVNVVSQTTQEEKIFSETAAVIKANAKICVISNTICQPTKARQSEIVELSQNVDLMIVVGGKHSANTTRLAELCSRLCPNTIHVESEDELNPAAVRAAENIGITAGASTPNWMTDRVLSRAVDIRKNISLASVGGLEKLWRTVIYSCVYTAFSAVALGYVCMKMQAIKPDLRFLALIWFYVLSMHIINRASEKGIGTSDSVKSFLYKKHRALMITIGLLAGAAALLTAAFLGRRVFTLMILFSIFGLLYPFRHFIRKGDDAFPGSKDIVTALGWTAVAVFVPAMFYGVHFSAIDIIAAVYASLLVFMRSVMLGISAVKTDFIIGKEHLCKALGDKAAKNIMLALAAAVTVLVLATAAWGWEPKMSAALLAGNVYMIIALIVYYKGTVPKTVYAETMLDGQFIFLAAATLISTTT